VHEAQPSRTALRVALRRAAHQVYDAPPLVLDDPLAVQILGPVYADDLRKTRTRLAKPFSAALRAFLVARSRYAETCLAQASSAGVQQYCILGAGLDTFAYRNRDASLRIFEVDHPATQAWKLDLLRSARIHRPENLTLVPIDFEQQHLATRLQASGFDSSSPAFFAWLGVVPYLTLDAFRDTLRFVATRPPGSGLVLDYGQPRNVLPPLEQLAHDSLAERVALAGEPFQLFFTPGSMAAELSRFRNLVDLGCDELNQLYFNVRTDSLRIRGSAARIVSAWIP